jgi:hypothetical protein
METLYFILYVNGQIVGEPFEWDKDEIENLLLTYNVDTTVSSFYSTTAIFYDDTRVGILPCEFNKPTYNPIYEYINDVEWSVENYVAYGTYTKFTKPLSDVKIEVKRIISHNRWAKEISGFPLEIQETVVTIDTERDTRAMYFQAAAMLPEEGTISWKFPEAHLNLTKANLQYIVYAGIQFIEGLFSEEYIRHQQVDSSLTIEEILEVDRNF